MLSEYKSTMPAGPHPQILTNPDLVHIENQPSTSPVSGLRSYGNRNTFGNLVHSSRSNIKGSAFSARRAGIHVASNPSAAIAITTPASTRGSRGLA
jgi:hypothetical protein